MEKDDNHVRCVPTNINPLVTRCQLQCLATSQLFTYDEEKDECTCRDCPDPDAQFIKTSVNICVGKSQILYCKLTCNGTCDESGNCKTCSGDDISVLNQCVAQLSYTHCENYVSKAENLLCSVMNVPPELQEIDDYRDVRRYRQYSYKIDYCEYPNIAKNECFSNRKEYYRDNLCYTVMTYYNNTSQTCNYCQSNQQVDDNRYQCIKSENYPQPLSSSISIVMIISIFGATFILAIILRFRINSHAYTQIQDIWEKMEAVSKLDTTDDWPLFDFEFPVNGQASKLGHDDYNKENTNPFKFAAAPFGMNQNGRGLFRPSGLFAPPKDDATNNHGAAEQETQKNLQQQK